MKLREREYENILGELKKIADSLGASVRFERGDFKGGYCLLMDSKVIVINKLSTTQRKVNILASALRELGVPDELHSAKTKMIFEGLEEE